MAEKKRRSNLISYFLSQIESINEGVTRLYENLMDNTIKDAIEDIDDLSVKLRELKSNLTTKESEI